MAKNKASKATVDAARKSGVGKHLMDEPGSWARRQAEVAEKRAEMLQRMADANNS